MCLFKHTFYLLILSIYTFKIKNVQKHIKSCYGLNMQRAPQNTRHASDLDVRKNLTRAFFALTAHWHLSRNDEARLLGWDYQTKRTTLDAMRLKRTIIDNDQDKLERMIDLINIHKSLRILFPYDRKLVYQWVSVKRERFGGYSALDVMLENGKLGITAIRHYLDHTRGA